LILALAVSTASPSSMRSGSFLWPSHRGLEHDDPSRWLSMDLPTYGSFTRHGDRRGRSRGRRTFELRVLPGLAAQLSPKGSLRVVAPAPSTSRANSSACSALAENR
jgi:hypothetical protein